LNDKLLAPLGGFISFFDAKGDRDNAKNIFRNTAINEVFKIKL
tara:strand:+ start:1495 stop:1623 length:129 start_codon:yes stop_codon:yes gene_type:complete